MCPLSGGAPERAGESSERRRKRSRIFGSSWKKNDTGMTFRMPAAVCPMRGPPAFWRETRAAERPFGGHRIPDGGPLQPLRCCYSDAVVQPVERQCFDFSGVSSRSDQQPQPFPFPPQQNRSRRISRQLSFPQLLNVELPFPQKQFSRSRIQITLHPQELPLNRPLFPESHPHPQFVAAKSLISFPPN